MYDYYFCFCIYNIDIVFRKYVEYIYCQRKVLLLFNNKGFYHKCINKNHLEHNKNIGIYDLRASSKNCPKQPKYSDDRNTGDKDVKQ